MKKSTFGFIILLPLACLYGQDSIPEGNKGEISALIYSNFNYGLNNANSTTAFEVTRAYFGYKRLINENFFAEVKLDIGSPDDLSEFSRIRRYTYFKTASVRYQKDKLTAWVGLFDMLQFKTQEKFWGYRYIYRSYMDEYRFGPSADIGIGARYELSKFFSADLIISNGEGYKSPQNDNSYKTGFGLSVFPLPGLTFRAYYTVFIKENPQMSAVAFIGYQRQKFRIGGEYIFQKNYRFYDGHNRFGYSIYSTFTLNKKWEVFVRYDQLYSNIIPESDLPWNLANDGSAIVGGFQYSPIKHINISLNYQDWVEYASNGASEPYIFMNFEIRF